MGFLYFFSVLFIYSFVCVYYVYTYRGNVRYDSTVEYFRKGWPIFTPFNCLLYMFTKKRAKKSIIDMNDFADLKVIEDNWEVISKEAQALHANKYFDIVKDPDAKSYFDLGFRTFYKYGWSKFYLNWYGYTHKSALKHCPETLKVLKKCKLVKGAMFSYLPPGGKLTRHQDPIACSLRYHLGLKTPNNDNCFINIDDQFYSWRDGKPLLFDETYIHFANNNTDEDRIILMCEVARPMNILGSFLNLFYRVFMKFSVVPNLPGDRRGLFNLVFSSLSPILGKTKNLKTTNNTLYKIIKYSVNTLLTVLLVYLFYGVFKLITYFF